MCFLFALVAISECVFPNHPQHPPGRGTPGRGVLGRGVPGRGFPGRGAPGLGGPGRGGPGRGAPWNGAPGLGAPGRGGPGHGPSGYGQPWLTQKYICPLLHKLHLSLSTLQLQNGVLSAFFQATCTSTFHMTNLCDNGAVRKRRRARRILNICKSNEKDIIKRSARE
ncbi:hypothetical protein V5799_028444 [Amblyomma americanum]|uniref:Uncharacterized protein n=1 Tax=Amblyomma americanum TaxID=6943 RepID=A0AAQ4DCU8_AMBAM